MPRPKRPMYEYKIVKLDTLLSADQLNELDAAHWHLITIVDYRGFFHYYFKRRKGALVPCSHSVNS